MTRLDYPTSKACICLIISRYDYPTPIAVNVVPPSFRNTK